MAGQRPCYSKDQLTQYFDRIRLPQRRRKYDVATLQPADALEHLTTLQQYQLAAVPFENLSLHYSSHRQICLHPEDLFQKIVGDNNGRGGYCMENNALFGTVLRSLGFTVYSAGGRVFEEGHWTGWGHMVNLVTIGDQKYAVDVGFGAEGPIMPIPLDRSGTVQKHLSPASVGLDWRNIPETTDPNQRFWVLKYRKSDESEWEPLKYCFTEVEFLPQDYGVMSHFVSTSPRTWFTRVVVVELKIMDESEALVGRLTIQGNSMKRRMGGEVIEATIFESEQDRLDALEKHFGIKFGAADREGIRGMISEIK